MSFRATTIVWERSRAKGSALLMMLAIADYAKDNGRDAWPSSLTLARKSRMSPRAVSQILARLEQDGEIVRTHDPKASRRYLHLRCVYDFENFQAEGEEAAGAEKSASANFAGGVNPPGEEGEGEGRQTLPPPIVEGPGKPCAPPCTGEVVPPATSRSAYKEDPVIDPVSDPTEGGLLKHHPVETVENPSVRRITKLAHAVLDSRIDGTRSDLVEDLKSRCALAQLPYDASLVNRALDAALWQRKDH